MSCERTLRATQVIGKMQVVQNDHRKVWFLAMHLGNPDKAGDIMTRT